MIVMPTPATAGPTMRARLNVIELSATAFGSWSRPTISITNDCRTGVSSADTQPSSRHSRYTCQSWASPVTSSSPNVSAHSARPLSSTSSSLRLSIRSASTPA